MFEPFGIGGQTARHLSMLAENAVTQVVADNTSTVIALGSRLNDDGPAWTPERVVVPRTGFWLKAGNIEWEFDSGGTRARQIDVGGIGLNQHAAPTASYGSIQSAIAAGLLTAGEVAQLVGQEDAGAVTLDILAGRAQFAIWRLFQNFPNGVTAAHIYGDFNESVTQNQDIKLSLNRLYYDTVGMADLANSQLIIRENGFYLLIASMRYSSGSGVGVRELDIMRNGTGRFAKAAYRPPTNTAYLTALNVACIADCYEGNRFTANTHQTNSIAQTSEVFSFGPGLIAIKLFPLPRFMKSGDLRNVIRELDFAPVTCGLINTTNIALPQNVDTPITWDTTLWDTDRMARDAAVSGFIRITRKGTYVVIVPSAFFNSSTGLAQIIYVVKNGVSIIAGYAAPANGSRFGASPVTISRCIPGDYLQVIMNRGHVTNSFSGAATEDDRGQCSFQIFRLEDVRANRITLM